GTTLPEGTHAFAAVQLNAYHTSPETTEFLVMADLTAPTIAVSVPATTPSKAPQIRVTAQDLNGLPNGPQVRPHVDLNNDGDYLDTSESSYTTGTLTDGAAVTTLPALSSTGTYRVRARVTDLAGNEGTSASSTFTVSAVTAYSVAEALVRTSDPALDQQ